MPAKAATTTRAAARRASICISYRAAELRLIRDNWRALTRTSQELVLLSLEHVLVELGLDLANFGAKSIIFAPRRDCACALDFTRPNSAFSRIFFSLSSPPIQLRVCETTKLPLQKRANPFQYLSSVRPCSLSLEHLSELLDSAFSTLLPARAVI